MKRLLSLFTFLVAAAGCSSTTPAPESTALQPDPALAGIWHACSEVGAGNCARIVLAPDGRFEARPAQGGCDRLAGRTGTWGMEQGALVIRESARTELVGGTCEKSDIGEELRGARPEPKVHAAPAVERLALADCSEADKSRSPAACRRFGDTPRWKLATDEALTPAP